MMTSEILKFLRIHRHTLFLLGAAVVGLLLGSLSIYFSPWLALGAIAGAGFFMLTLRKPEILLISIPIMTSTVLDAESVPSVPGFSSVKLTDIALLMLLGLVTVRGLSDPDFKIIRTPLDLPLLAFYGSALLSSTFAMLNDSLKPWRAYSELQILSYYLIYFAITNLLRKPQQCIFLIKGTYSLALIVAIMMSAQFLLGDTVTILPGRVETLNTQGTSYTGITRILPPGQSLILVAFITQVVRLTLTPSKSADSLAILGCCIMGIGLILTFSRSFWMGAGLALLILFILLPEKNRLKFAGIGLIALIITLSIYIFTTAKPDSQFSHLIHAALARFNTTTSTTNIMEDQSFRWRYPEYQHALSQIIQHPLIGIGFGAQYRPLDMRMDSASFDGRAYMHNGHLWIITKSGILGYLSLLWLSACFITRGLKYWRLIPDTRMQGCVLGFTLTYLSMLLIAIVSPIFMQRFWTPVIGLMMGTNEIIFRHYLKVRNT